MSTTYNDVYSGNVIEGEALIRIVFLDGDGWKSRAGLEPMRGERRLQHVRLGLRVGLHQSRKKSYFEGVHRVRTCWM